MYPRLHSVSITTSTAGAGTGYTDVDHGRILSVQLASTNLGSTGSVAYTNETTSEAILTKAPATTKAVYYPRPVVCNSTGGAIKVSTGASIPDYFYLSDHRVKISLAGVSVGTAKTATFRVTVG